MNATGSFAELVIPCRDEAGALPALLARVPEEFAVIVVDNGSSDATADVARAMGARVVTEHKAGYGAAVHAGMEAARAEYVGVIDGDGSMDPAILSALLAIVESGEATMAIGRRRPVARGVWPWHARAGTALLAWLIRRRSNFSVHDLAPMRVCRRADLLALGIEDRRFGYPLELMVKAADSGWTVHEIEIDYRKRTAGRSKVSGSVRGTAKVMVDFAKVMR